MPSLSYGMRPFLDAFASSDEEVFTDDPESLDENFADVATVIASYSPPENQLDFEGKRHGTWITKIGPRTMVEMYDHGMMHGIRLVVKFKCAESIEHYSYGLLHGVCIEYYPTGKRKMLSTYVLGELDGMRVNYTPTGALRTVQYLSSNIPNGAFFAYHDGGAIMREYYYSNGARVGIWRVWSEDGHLIIEEDYRSPV
jgi:hypothetical protein